MDYHEYYEKAFEITDPDRGGAVYQAALKLLNSEWFVWFNLALCAVTFIVFLAYALSKEGRDERGRAILGTACLYGTVTLVILLNIMGMFSITVITNLAIFTNCLRIVCNGYFITTLIAIAVLRKIR